MSQVNGLDAHQRPPEQMRSLFKRYQKCNAKDLCVDAAIIDMQRTVDDPDVRLNEVPESHHTDRDSAFEQFLSTPFDEGEEGKAAFIPTFEVTSIPGLHILPQLLPPKVQLLLLERLLYRDLSDPNHRTNLHLHYDISYPPKSFSDRLSSFFSMDKAMTFSPKDPSVHKPISTTQFLEKKLRWMTLGGQYDWTAKRYPSESPPPFPADLKQLLKRLFPEMDAQAAIVNFYSPGDTLSVHRDVSEDCDQGLVSISLGCDGIFVVGNQDGTAIATIRLRSGDAVYMTGSSRYAWHGVPKIIPSTCPEWLATWPASGDDGTQNDPWQRWMSQKRINLNVRQMKLKP